MIPCQRQLFDIPREVAYLNCAYMSPLLNSVRDAGIRGVAAKSRPWKLTAQDFFPDSETARALFARLINATADDVAFIPSVSYGIAVAARNLPVGPGDEVLVLAEQFPSNLYPWKNLCAREGATLVTVPRPDDDDWTSAILARLSERTAVAALPHCHWTDGTLVDLEAVAAALRGYDARLVLDLTQSLGALPFDVARVRPDFLICATYKWLLGPYSMGFLYAAPAYHDGTALEENWLNRANSANFARLIDYTDRYQPGARRFDVGERSNFALMPMVIAALEQILAWDPARIQVTLAAYTGTLAEELLERRFRTTATARRSGHFLGVIVDGDHAKDILQSLGAAQIFVSHRGDRLRVTPHLYNDDYDARRFLAGLTGVS